MHAPALAHPPACAPTGPENAGNKWVEVFSWVRERKGLGEERKRRRCYSVVITHDTSCLRALSVGRAAAFRGQFLREASPSSHSAPVGSPNHHRANSPPITNHTPNIHINLI